jgi:arsenate reductase
MVPDSDGKNPTGGVRGARHRLRGPSRIDAVAPAKPQASASVAKKRVLFVCIGNSCRSQMAEAFARAYGADIIEPQSAGVSPATIIAPLTKQTLGERNLNIDGHFPKGMDLMQRRPFDVVVNMSGRPVGLPGAQVIEWAVPDPIGHDESYYRTVATQIEGLVMRLILELRTA